MTRIYIFILTAGFLMSLAAWAQEAAQNPVSATTMAYHADARRVLTDILANKEFRDLHEPHRIIPKWFSDYIASFFEWLEDMLGSLPTWIQWIVKVWLIGCAIAILGHLAYTLYQALSPFIRASRTRKGEHPLQRGEILGVRELDYHTVYSEALRLMHEGDWPNALRHLMAAAILRLELEGLIIRRRFKTNGSYLQELMLYPEDQIAFRQITTLAEPVLYGQLPASQDRCQSALEALSRITRNGSKSTTAV